MITGEGRREVVDISEEEVLKALKEIKSVKCAGLDEIA